MSYKTILDASMMGTSKPASAAKPQSATTTVKKPVQSTQRPAVQTAPQQSTEVQTTPQQGTEIQNTPVADVGGQSLINETAAQKLTALDLQPLREALNEWERAADQKARNAADYAVRKAVAELERAQTEAGAMYDAQRAQIALDEANARDNQSLYAQARGDKGGIAAAQYDAIANTAARNRMAVNSAQIKLASDTAQKVADLRAQGEFEAADAALRNAQQKLSQLVSLEKWGLETGLSVDQFNIQLDKWAAEQNMEAAQNEAQRDKWAAEQALAVEKYNTDKQQWEQERRDKLSQNQITAGRWQQEIAMEQAEMRRKQLAQAGEALLEAGVMPSSSQLEALGMTAVQARNYISALRLQGAYRGK